MDLFSAQLASKSLNIPKKKNGSQRRNSYIHPVYHESHTHDGFSNHFGSF